MNLKMVPNKSLKGHKLLILSPWKPSAAYLDKLRGEHADLEIVHYALPWGGKIESVPEEEWQDVTILLSGSSMPSRDQAPKLEYVQLLSAGANQILKNPLFTDTNIAFCTANGVHGCVADTNLTPPLAA